MIKLATAFTVAVMGATMGFTTGGTDDELINRPDPAISTVALEASAPADSDDGSVEGVEMAMLFSCYHINYVEIGAVRCYQL
ncbi:hypothetical protein [Loktanella sp. SALINAS62]|uniref:hypothetical protein n=1 Tax=Loktanella sp. SALINAS62 TaxID=2706124 RepID=UPI001B8D5A14|nr:hypothetical protein [Loktanella sp. SALINAS62]MBS1301978.1 hypothetical protein [Loktanella sp. SALINAS62]